MCDGGQTLLERLGIVTGDLVVEPGAGESKDVDGGGRGLLPAWAGGGQCLGLAGAVACRHRPDQEAGRIDERRAACRPGPIDDPRAIRTQEDVSGLKSVCSSASPSSRSTSASRSTYAAQRCRACVTTRPATAPAARHGSASTGSSRRRSPIRRCGLCGSCCTAAGEGARQLRPVTLWGLTCQLPRRRGRTSVSTAGR